MTQLIGTRTKFRRAPLIAVGLTALLAACSSYSQDATEAAGPSATSPSAAASPEALAHSSPPSSSLPCDDLLGQTADIPATLDQLARLVGTDADAAAALEALAGVAPRLAPLVSACAPTVEDAMWQFLTDVEELRQKFSTGNGRTEMSQTKLRLITVRAGGMDLFERIGVSSESWADLPTNAQLSCGDAKEVGALVTWDVRHLANLIGSENVTDADGYIVELKALTAALAALVDQCKPKARQALNAFGDSMDRLGEAYQPGGDAEVIAQNKEAMTRLRAAGIALFGKLGIDDTGWKVVPTTEQ